MSPAPTPEPALRSWTDTAAQTIYDYIARVCTSGSADFVPPPDRVAVFDNDGTLWCEKPAYPQALYVLDRLRSLVADEPELAEKPVVKQLLAGDLDGALRDGGLGAVAEVLLSTDAGVAAEEFTERVRAWFAIATHPGFSVRWTDLVYAPMRELLDVLRAHEFRTFIVTGGGVEFVRAVSEELYDIDRDDVVGSAVQLAFERRDDRAVLVREAALLGSPNEGPPKAVNIQMHVGRRPIFAAGNTAGDREMLEYTAGSTHPSLCLAIDHDDAEREFEYAGSALTSPDAESLTDTARREGWTVVSMQRDWTRIFAKLR